MTTVVMLERNSFSKDVVLRPLRPPLRWKEYPSTPPDQAAHRIGEAEIIAVNKQIIDQDTLAACPNLKHIAVGATGYNTIDVQACQKLGISISNIPSYAGNTVAEHVINLSLSLRRELIQYRQKVIDGAWQQSATFCLFDKPVNEVRGARMGIVGLGDIGQHVARLAHAMGMEVVYSARRKIANEHATQVSFDELLESSDIISLHCSLNTSTVDLIGAAELERMQKHAILINTARGGIVNEMALVDAIENQKIGATGVDVLVVEPPKEYSPLLAIANRSNVIITPHISWTSRQAMQALADILIDNIEAFYNGSPTNLVG